MRALLAGRVPPEGPWELQGIELLSQNQLYHQILLLMHLLPQDLLLLQVRPLPPAQLGPGPPLLGCRRGPTLARALTLRCPAAVGLVSVSGRAPAWLS